MRLLARIVGRIVPALLMAAGVTLVATGLLSYAAPSGARNAASPSDSAAVPTPSTIFAATPLPPDSLPPTLSATPIAPTATPSPATSGAVPSATATASSPPAPTVTRVALPALGIDLPVISRLQPVPGQGPDFYPPCDVAIDDDAFVQPSQAGTTYLYAHAQAGMFLPLLLASRQPDSGASMLGDLIEVYTDDDRLYVYSVDQVKRHATDFAIAATSPGQYQVVLQTSEGPFGTVLKLQVAGDLVRELPATDADAHPTPQPRACYPG